VNNSLKIKPDHLKTFEPLTENQRLFFEMYKGGAYFMGLFGCPGVGKTFLALYKSLEEVLDKSNSFKQVVVVRSLVQLRDVGYLPGNLDEKQEIYELPYKEIASTPFGRSDAWDRLKEQNHVRFISTTAIRGISIDDAIILVDENQNLNWSEVNTIITRVGHRSKIIFSGDPGQLPPINEKISAIFLKNYDDLTFHKFRDSINRDKTKNHDVYTKTVLEEKLKNRYEIFIDNLKKIESYVLKEVMRTKKKNVVKACLSIRHWIEQRCDLPAFEKYNHKKGVEFYNYQGQSKLNEEWFKLALDDFKNSNENNIILT